MSNKSLFKHVLEGMKNNNQMHGGSFADWDDAQRAIDTYSETFTGEISESEMRITIECLDIIIKKNQTGGAIKLFNDKIWGTQFSNNYGPDTI